MAKLTDREKIIIECAAFGPISAIGTDYVRLGGYGTVPVRYHFATLNRLKKLGFLEHYNGNGSIYSATDAGKAAIAKGEDNGKT